MGRRMLTIVVFAFCLAATVGGPITSLVSPSHTAAAAWADGGATEPPTEPEPGDTTGPLTSTADSTSTLGETGEPPEENSSMIDMLWLILQGL